MNLDPRVKTGDIVIVREFNVTGFLMRLLFPKTILTWPSERNNKWPPIHNGLWGICGGKEGIFEANIGKYFHFTPWEVYKKKIKSGEFEVKIVRHPHINDDQRLKLNTHLNVDVKKKKKYDSLGAISVIIDTISRRIILRLNSRRKWYCSEIVNHAYTYIGIDFLGKEFPSPYAIEKKVKDGTLIEVADFYKVGSKLSL